MKKKVGESDGAFSPISDSIFCSTRWMARISITAMPTEMTTVVV